MNPKKYPVALVAVKPSKSVKGEVGLFALRDINEGTVIMAYTDLGRESLMSYDDFDKLDDITKERMKHFCVQYPDGIWVPDNINNMTLHWHMNHKCDPNVCVDENDNRVAARDIKAGEELFLDFSTIFKNPEYSLKCNCGSPQCRGIVNGKDDIPEGA